METKDAKQLMTELNESWHQMKAKLDQRDAEIAKYGEAKAETEASIKALNDRIDETEVAQKRHVQGAEAKAADRETQEKKEAFIHWARKGDRLVTPDQVKLLSVGDDSNGGYLAPAEMANEIIKAVVEFSPLRSICRVYSTSQKEVQFPKRTGTATASWVAEATEATPTNANYGLETIKANEMVSAAEITNALLEDAAFNLVAELQTEMSEQFGKAEGAAFISGDGVNKPEGILANADVAFVANGHASALQADAIISLMYAVKTAYAMNGTFAMNRSTLAAVRKLKDSQGQYLYEPNQALGLPPTIQGKGFIEAPDMPDIAANAFPILFGDFRRGYIIIDRQQISVVRDDLTLALKRVVRFVGSKRVGGQVVLAEAIKKLKIAV